MFPGSEGPFGHFQTGRNGSVGDLFHAGDCLWGPTATGAGPAGGAAGGPFDPSLLFLNPAAALGALQAAKQAAAAQQNGGRFSGLPLLALPHPFAAAAHQTPAVTAGKQSSIEALRLKAKEHAAAASPPVTATSPLPPSPPPAPKTASPN